MAAIKITVRPNGPYRVEAPEGSIEMRWWTDAEGGHLAVSDTGFGIPSEHIPRLTERFYRVDAGRSKSVGGTGLGLAIVKHIVNRHRGALEIDSEIGEGSTFTVYLPLPMSAP